VASDESLMTALMEVSFSLEPSGPAHPIGRASPPLDLHLSLDRKLAAEPASKFKLKTRIKASNDYFFAPAPGADGCCGR
jgi:hypothetical protein